MEALLKECLLELATEYAVFKSVSDTEDTANAHDLVHDLAAKLLARGVRPSALSERSLELAADWAQERNGNVRGNPDELDLAQAWLAGHAAAFPRP